MYKAPFYHFFKTPQTKSATFIEVSALNLCLLIHLPRHFICFLLDQHLPLFAEKIFELISIAIGNVYCAFLKTQDLKFSLLLILKNLTGLKWQFSL